MIAITVAKGRNTRGTTIESTYVGSTNQPSGPYRLFISMYRCL